MRAEYYYDRITKMWRVDILDEDSNVIDYEYTYSEKECLFSIGAFREVYKIDEVIKTKFNK